MDALPQHACAGGSSALLQELKEAGPTILSASHKDATRDYEEELLPAVEKVARTGRLLYIAVDT